MGAPPAAGTLCPSCSPIQSPPSGSCSGMRARAGWGPWAVEGWPPWWAGHPGSHSWLSQPLPAHLPFSSHTWVMREECGPQDTAGLQHLVSGEQSNVSILRLQEKHPPLLYLRECQSVSKRSPPHPFKSPQEQEGIHFTARKTKATGQGNGGVWMDLLSGSRTTTPRAGTQAPQLQLARPQAWGQVYHAHGETEARGRETHPRSEGTSEPKCGGRTPMGWECLLPRLTSRRGLSGS